MARPWLILPLLAAALGGAAVALTTPSLLAGPAAVKARACHAVDGMAYVASGEVRLGEDGPDRPGRRVRIGAFWIDRHEVTNRQFAAFVAATGYRTRAERDGAGAVFVQPMTLADPEDARQWWRLVKGAAWRHPQGPASDANPDAPAVQVTFEDAEAYARWAGGALPSEAQWERAARAGQAGPVAPAAWAYDPEGRPRANTWQGVFPLKNTDDDGFDGLAPVGCFAPNALGLYDMIGNAWEWTDSGGGGGGVRLIKGGSFLCAFNYCANFRPAAWQAQAQDFGASHIGFRIVRTTPPLTSARQVGGGPAAAQALDQVHAGEKS